MKFLEEIAKILYTEPIKKIYGFILTALGAVFVAIFYWTRNWVEQRLSVRQMFYIAVVLIPISISLLCLAYILHARLRATSHYIFRFNAFWDKNNDPHCVTCFTHLRTTKDIELLCSKCGLMPLRDDAGKPLSLNQAKELLAGKSIDTKNLTSLTSHKQIQPEKLDSLSEIILKIIAISGTGSITPEELCEYLYEHHKVERVQMQHCINQLDKNDYIYRHDEDFVQVISLSDKGIEYVATKLVNQPKLAELD